MRSIFLRPLQFALLGVALLILGLIGIQGWLEWRSLERLTRIQSGVSQIQTIQEAGLEMQRLMIEDVSGDSKLDRAHLAGAREELAKLTPPKRALAPGTMGKLEQAERLLADTTRSPLAQLGDALLVVRQALYGETNAELAFLAALYDESRNEMKLAAAAFLLLPGGLLLAFWLARERIFRPIDNLKDLLVGLGGGRFDPVPVRNVDPLLLPLFDNYNRMVERLRELEQRHHEHTVSLEREVRAATHALLEQSQSLARAERLAVVGELSAAVAHELRNPLAGIQMTLANLRREVAEPSFAERLDLVVAELQRITRLLNDLLAPSRHAPQPRRVIRLAPLVEDLLRLTRYQIPPQIELDVRVPRDLECEVPADALRQALLNLVLNAVQALGNRAGTIAVTAQRDGGDIHVSVRDDGPGFPDALVQGGVRPFATGREGGTGLGLAIVQRFARDIQGELRLGNLASGGASAELRIPGAT